MDTTPSNFDPNYELANLDPRENFPYSAHEAEDEYDWAKENGLADEDCDGPCFDGDTGNRWA